MMKLSSGFARGRRARRGGIRRLSRRRCSTMITTSTQAPKAMPLAPAGPPAAAPQPPAPKAPAFSGGKPVAMPFSKEDPKRQQKLLIGGIGGGALVVALTLLFVFRPWKRAEPPRLTAEPAKLGALAATPDFQ